MWGGEQGGFFGQMYHKRDYPLRHHSSSALSAKSTNFGSPDSRSLGFSAKISK